MRSCLFSSHEYLHGVSSCWHFNELDKSNKVSSEFSGQRFRPRLLINIPPSHRTHLRMWLTFFLSTALFALRWCRAGWVGSENRKLPYSTSTQERLSSETTLYRFYLSEDKLFSYLRGEDLFSEAEYENKFYRRSETIPFVFHPSISCGNVPCVYLCDYLHIDIL